MSQNKREFPPDINFREFELIIQQRLYRVFGTLPGYVKILFVFFDGDDASFFLKITAGDENKTTVYVHLEYGVTFSDFIYNITDLRHLQQSILKRMETL